MNNIWILIGLYPYGGKHGQQWHSLCAMLLVSPVQIWELLLDLIHVQNEWSHCQSTWKTCSSEHVNRAVAKQRTASLIPLCTNLLSQLSETQLCRHCSYSPSQKIIRGNWQICTGKQQSIWPQQVNHFSSASHARWATVCMFLSLPVESFLNKVFITVPCSFTLSHSLTISPTETKCSTSLSAITCNLNRTKIKEGFNLNSKMLHLKKF